MDNEDKVLLYKIKKYIATMSTELLLQVKKVIDEECNKRLTH